MRAPPGSYLPPISQLESRPILDRSSSFFSSSRFLALASLAAIVGSSPNSWRRRPVIQLVCEKKDHCGPPASASPTVTPGSIPGVPAGPAVSSSSSSKYAGSTSSSSTSSPCCSPPAVFSAAGVFQPGSASRAVLPAASVSPALQAPAAVLTSETPCRPCSLTAVSRSAKKLASAAITGVFVATITKDPSKVTLTTPVRTTTPSRIAAFNFPLVFCPTFNTTWPRSSPAATASLPPVVEDTAVSVGAGAGTAAEETAPSGLAAKGSPTASISPRSCCNSSLSTSAAPSASAFLHRANADLALPKSKRCMSSV
mmetsp:Transcript_15116/g.41802  ORF Transcript_15116/g.41802 Transcript_15116/m.41802 type:complete len:312 (-) Transcript_15116:243-1178(-)